MDDDWLVDDSQVDMRELETRNAHVQQQKIQKQQHDQGYLAGLDWADENWQSLDGDPTYSRPGFQQGKVLGARAAQSRLYKYTVVGKMNLMLIIGQNSEAVSAILKRLDSCDTDEEIPETLRAEIDQLLEHN